MRKLITADSHVAFPWSLVDQLPSACREKMPHLEQRADGNYLITPAAVQYDGMTGLKAKAGERKIADDRELRKVAHDNVVPGAEPDFGPEGRLADMSKEGIEAAVLVGPVTRLRLEPDMDLAYCRVINDWLADTYKGHYDRFAPAITMPIGSCKAAVAELERAAAAGLRPLLLPDTPALPYYMPQWEPLWEAASALKMPIAIHVSPTRGASMSQPFWAGTLETTFYMSSVSMGEVACWFTLSGVLARYPDLRIVLTEGYAGWFSFLIEFLDHQLGVSDRTHGGGRFSDWLGLKRRGFKLEAPPSHYLRRQVCVTFTWDPVAIEMRHRTGLDCLMWGNDYPHIEGAFPHSQSWVEHQFSGVPEAEVDQIVCGNAARIFGFQV
jgi:predicted TIM-barrel fold metal-dependent hydrolase